MFGKFFATTFTGSMMGSGTDVFAVWGYVIANAQHSQIELNPKLLAAVLGSTPEAMQAAIDVLCAPDPNSRSGEHSGMRLLREGQFAYHVVNHEKYRALRNDDDRREYFRQKKAESRARLSGENVKAPSQTKSKCPPMSTAVTQPDTEPESREQKHTNNLPESPAEPSGTTAPEKKLTPSQQFAASALEIYADAGAVAPPIPLLMKWNRECMNSVYDWTLRELKKLAVSGYLSNGTAYVAKALKNIGEGNKGGLAPEKTERIWKDMETLP